MTQFPHLFLGLHPQEDALKILQGALFFCALAYAHIALVFSHRLCFRFAHPITRNPLRCHAFWRLPCLPHRRGRGERGGARRWSGRWRGHGGGRKKHALGKRAMKEAVEEGCRTRSGWRRFYAT